MSKEAVAESVIQRFEVCYDCLWKVLKRYMVEELGLADVPNSPKPILRIAFENNLITTIGQWLIYADARTSTSHDYNENKAQESLAIIENFIVSATQIYTTMTGTKWKF